MVISCSDVQAQRVALPDKVDLRAVYCAKIDEHMLTVLAKPASSSTPPAAQEVSKRLAATERANLQRIRLYLMPRIPYLDPVGLASAAKSAKSDIREADRKARACAAQCIYRADWIECTVQCNSGSEVAARMRRCRDTSWLPF